MPEPAPLSSLPSFGARVDRRLLKRGFRDGRPLLALSLIELRRVLAAPFRWLASRLAWRRYANEPKWATFVSRTEGYRLFEPSTFPELPEVVAAGQAVFERHRQEVADQEVYNKPYFFNLLDVDDLRRYPVLATFALSKPVTEIVTGYLRQVPRLHSMGVFYSAVSDTIDGSQMYHVDGDALAQVKCFVNLWDVDQGGGPFTFLPKRVTRSRLRHGGLLKTLSDDDVLQGLAPTDLIKATGEVGSGIFVDTSRCLHQGSRAREQPRLVFQFQYVSRPDALLPRAQDNPVRGGHLYVTRRLVEGLPLDEDDVKTFVG